MTQEEIIKKGNEKYPQDIIEIINDDGSITREDVNFKIRKAYMEGLIDNNIPLPSNLEDAARKYKEDVPIDTIIYYCGTDEDVYFTNRIVDAFIAGAKWQKEQMNAL